MRDPYDVLGVRRNASDDEIKKAYRTLSRRYHPDANVNNPNKAQAEEKFKEVQQAYQQIQDEKEGTSKSGGYGPGSSRSYGGYSGYSGYARQEQGHGTSDEDVRMRAAANFINSRHYAEAMNVLNGIAERNAQWYYYSAVANAGSGNNVAARQMAQSAVNMEPYNQTYRQFLQSLERGGAWYQNMGNMYGSPMDAGNDMCLNLCLANALCSCCGPGVFCFI